LDPYYKRAQEILKIGPDIYGGEYWIKRAGLPYLHFHASNVYHYATQIRPTRFGIEYHDDIKNAPNIFTYLNANVMSLETDSVGKEVERVNVGTLGGNRFRISARLFILACGGIENARLLLISKIGRNNGLGNQHDLVGRFFMEHPIFDAGMILLKNSGFKLEESFYRPHKIDENIMIQGQLSLMPEVLRSKKIANFKVYLLPYSKRRLSAGELSLRSILKDFKALRISEDFLSHLARVISDIDEVAEEAYVKYFVEDRQRLIITRSIFEQVPNPDSRVTLSAEKDALGINRVKLDWRLTDMDRRGVHDALMVVASELGRMGLGRMKVDSGMDDWVFPDKPYWGNHHMGTTRMHEDPKQGVVDSNCRVHDVNNLYIAGSSVFPTSGCASPTLTIVALALRLAEHLKQEFIQ
jgi:choline dehydrogenase-like flavoprotein